MKPPLARVLAAALFAHALTTAAIPALADHITRETMARASFRLDQEPCWTGLGSEREMRCGELTVPLDWNDPASPMQRLPVLIFKADPGADEREPMVYLEGGPGYPPGIDNAEGVEDWMLLLRDFAWTRERDFIIPAQRGTIAADMHVPCPLLGDPTVYAGASSTPGGETDAAANVRHAVMVCRDAMGEAGYRLEALTTRQNATDIIALRHAMGIERWTLFGVSYGTNLGLTMMRHDPAGTASAILDSVMLPALDTPDRWPDAFDRSLTMIFDACRAQVLCRFRFGDLEAALAAIVDRLAREPMEIEVPDPDRRRSLYIRVDAALFLDILFVQMYWPDQIVKLPLLIDEWAGGKHRRFIDFAQAYLFDPTEEDFAFGMHYSIWCNELNGAVDLDKVRRQAERFPLLRDWIVDIPVGWITVCEDWPMAPPDPRRRAPVVSDVPALLLAGEFDPATPVEYARQAAATLSRAQLFVFPAAGHAVLWSEACADDIVAAFLAAPHERPDTGCPDASAELDFELF